MTRFDGIKKARVKVKRNTYDSSRAKKNSDGNTTFWRYVIAALIVISVFAFSSFTSVDASKPFKSDYALYEEA